MSINHIKYILGNIPIFWINLEKSVRRRTIMNDFLKNHNILATRLNAVDGDNINIDEYKQNYTINEKMSKYEIACAMSHLNIIKHCYDNHLEYALILEDDAMFDYFEYHTLTMCDLINLLHKKNGDCIQLCNVINRKYFNTFVNNSNILKRGSLAGASAYLITLTGMEKVLNNFNNNKHIEVSEHMIFNKLNNYIVNPYFTYPFLRDNDGNKVNLSFIRLNTKGAHATQTISKQLWDNYYKNNKKII